MLGGFIRWTELLIVGVYTQQQTQSPFIVAVMLFTNAIPGPLFGALVGALAERVSRKRLLVGGFIALTIVYTVLAVLAFTGRIALWHVAIGTFLNGTVWTTEYPVRRTMLGEIAGLPRAATALSLDLATGTAMLFLGPLLGGYLLRDYGLSAYYLLGAALFVLSLAALAFLGRLPESTAPARARLWGVLSEGLLHIRGNPPVAGVLVVTILLNFFGFSFMSMIPVIGDQKLAVGPELIGILASMEGAGSFLGLLLLTLYAAPRFYMRLFTGGSIVLLAMICLFSGLHSYWLCVVVLLLVGIGESGFSSMQATITFSATPPEMRRRVMGVLVVCIGSGPLGVLHTGLMAEWLGADVAVGVAALEGLIGLAICLWRWPTLRASGLSRVAIGPERAKPGQEDEPVPALPSHPAPQRE
jgi:MFS family permease